MTLASDPFGMLSPGARQARPAAQGRKLGADLWRGFQRICAPARREDETAPAMTEVSWQAGFAAMWDQDALHEDHADTPAQDRGGMKFL